MKTNPRRSLAATSLVLVLALGACGSDADTASAPEDTPTTAPTTTVAGDLDAFCALGATIEQETAAIDSPEAAVEVFTELDDTLTGLEEAAPPAVADDARTFVETALVAVETGDFSAFEDGTVDELVANFDAACVDATATGDGETSAAYADASTAVAQYCADADALAEEIQAIIDDPSAGGQADLLTADASELVASSVDLTTANPDEADQIAACSEHLTSVAPTIGAP